MRAVEAQDSSRTPVLRCQRTRFSMQAISQWPSTPWASAIPRSASTHRRAASNCRRDIARERGRTGTPARTLGEVVRAWRPDVPMGHSGQDSVGGVPGRVGMRNRVVQQASPRQQVSPGSERGNRTNPGAPILPTTLARTLFACRTPKDRD